MRETIAFSALFSTDSLLPWHIAPRGNVPMVRWVSNNYFPPPWTAEKRCQEVA